MAMMTPDALRTSGYSLTLMAGLFFSGCVAPCEIEVRQDEADPNRVELVWPHTDDKPTVRYTVPGEPPQKASVEKDGNSWVSVIDKLPTLTDIQYQITGERIECDDSFETYDTSIKPIEVSVLQADQPDDWQYVVAVMMNGSSGKRAIIDREGRVRWSEAYSGNLGTSHIELFEDQMYYNVFHINRSIDESAVLHRPLLSDADRDTKMRTPGGHHAFAIKPDGTVAVPSVDVRPWTNPETNETMDLVGDRILEIAPDGTEREVFSIWDHEEPYIHEYWSSRFYGDLGKDWSHANALHYSAERDSYLISFGNISLVYEVDAQTGEPLMRISPDMVVDSAPFHFQHDTTWTEDGTLMMISYPRRMEAIAVEYRVDAEAGRLETVWEYNRGTGGTFLMGQARRLSNGNTWVNYAAMGEMREVTPDGEIVWQINTSLGTWFGNVTLTDTLPEAP